MSGYLKGVGPSRQGLVVALACLLPAALAAREVEDATGRRVAVPDRVERVKAFAPMKRGGKAEEVASAILWLLSEEASYTTGSFIDVSGGR